MSKIMTIFRMQEVDKLQKWNKKQANSTIDQTFCRIRLIGNAPYWCEKTFTAVCDAKPRSTKTRFIFQEKA